MIIELYANSDMSTGLAPDSKYLSFILSLIRHFVYSSVP